MAFRQPTHHAPQRTTYSQVPAIETEAPTQQQQQHLADSQEWILFSPSQTTHTVTNTGSYTTSTARTRTRTEGRSRISDFGSLNSATRSYAYDEAETEGTDEEEEGDEEGELDSLDSHLHEFHTAEGERSFTTPQHDGLGSFRIDGGNEVQEHLYAFERYNPRRREKRRRQSGVTDLVAEGLGEIDSERAQETERVRRIEKWRLEQSRVLVDEIQRESRRRKQSMSSAHRSVIDQEQEDVATLSNVDAEDDGDRGFWNRITRRVIRDLMGIDHDLLSIILGESLPEELSSTPTPTSTTNDIIPSNDHESWEYKLFERIARELGILVTSQILPSERHSGAFSTYLRNQNTPLPYAGLPLEVIPESAPRPTESPLNPADPTFQPTLPTQPIPIPSATSLAEDIAATPTPTNHTLSREEWERDLDLKTIFRYLRAKFSSPSEDSPLSALGPSDLNIAFQGTSHLATASTADSAARAARVRATHPLVNGKVRPTRPTQKSWRASVPGSPSAGSGIGIGRARRSSSSCATSERVVTGWGSGNGKRSASERHYWDWGSSVSGGNAGSVGWGEV